MQGGIQYEKKWNHRDNYNFTNPIWVSNESSPTNSRRRNERIITLINGTTHSNVGGTNNKKMRESDWTASFFISKRNYWRVFFTTSKKICYNK